MTTPPHKVHPNVIARFLMTSWVKRNWWWIIVPPVTAVIIAAATHDLRFLFVALIWIFLVAPPIMIIVYFYHALSPEARYSIRLHTITTTPQGITVSYPPEPQEEDTDKPTTFPDDFIPWDQITKVLIKSGHMALQLNGRAYTYILIPLSHASQLTALTDRFRGLR